MPSTDRTMWLPRTELNPREVGGMGHGWPAEELLPRLAAGRKPWNPEEEVLITALRGATAITEREV